MDKNNNSKRKQQFEITQYQLNKKRQNNKYVDQNICEYMHCVWRDRQKKLAVKTVSEKQLYKIRQIRSLPLPIDLVLPIFNTNLFFYTHLVYNSTFTSS